MGASFKDLIVWQRAVELTTEIYRLTAAFPPSEQFGLSNQLRRASVSIASNIEEAERLAFLVPCSLVPSVPAFSTPAASVPASRRPADPEG